MVQTRIHHPTDSSLLTDGVRVLSRAIRRAKPLVGERLADVRDALRTRLRTMRRGLQALHRLARLQGEEVAEARTTIYKKLIETAEQTVAQAKQVGRALREAGEAAGQRGQQLGEQIARFAPLAKQIIHQARRRVREKQPVPSAEKVVSLFEPHTQIIPHHKGGAAVECGRTIVVDEVDGGLVTRCHVLGPGESTQDELPLALAHHQDLFGHPPTLVVGDRGTHKAHNERIAQEAGVRHLVISRSGALTPAQRQRKKEPRWRQRYRWRPGSEGRISSLRHNYGLEECPYHGEAGLQRSRRVGDRGLQAGPDWPRIGGLSPERRRAARGDRLLPGDERPCPGSSTRRDNQEGAVEGRHAHRPISQRQLILQ